MHFNNTIRSNLSTIKFIPDKCRIQLFLVNLYKIMNQHYSLLSGHSCHLIKEHLCHLQSNCNDMLSNIHGLYGADSEMYCWPLYASVCTASYAAYINMYHYLNKHDISFFSQAGTWRVFKSCTAYTALVCTSHRWNRNCLPILPKVLGNPWLREWL